MYGSGDRCRKRRRQHHRPAAAERGAHVGAGVVPGNYLAVGTSKAALEALTGEPFAVEFSRIGLVGQSASASPRLAY